MATVGTTAAAVSVSGGPSGGGGGGVVGPTAMDNTNSPLSVWNFDNVLTDGSGNGETLVHNAGTQNFGSSPIPGKQGLRFDVAATYDVTSAAFRLPGAITIMAMVNLRNLTGRKFLVSCGAGGLDTEANNHLWSMAINGSQLEAFHEHDAGVNDILFSVACLRVDEPLHLAITKTADGLGASFYVNASLASSGTFANAATGGSNSKVTVGAIQDTVSDPVINTDVYGIKIVPSELSAAQIQVEAANSLVGLFA